MTFNSLKMAGESPENLLKTLAVVISENNKGTLFYDSMPIKIVQLTFNQTGLFIFCFLDVANRVYEVMRGVLLDKKNAARPANQNLIHFDRNSRETTADLESYLFDRRLVKQYLETINPATAQQFSEYSERIQNEVRY